MKQLQIALQYFYITNRVTLEKIRRDVYTPTKSMKNDYLTKTIHGELSDINKLELNVMISTKSIVVKQVRL